MKEVRVGIIGIGNMGSAHANCILSGQVTGLVLGAVCDKNPDVLQRFQIAHPEVWGCTDYQDLLHSGKVDAVIVSVPHKLHCHIASEALSCGLHTLVEKPIDVSITAAKNLYSVAEKSVKVFAIMFNQRTNPLFQKAREIVQSGELGELKRSVWIITNWYRTQSYYDSGSWRASWFGEGGGVLLNQAPHQLDLWQWICGMPTSITAFCDVAKYHNIEVEDDATIFARYANGATGLFVTSTGEYPGTNRLEITGTRGKLLLENGVLKLWYLPESERDICFTSKESSPKIPLTYKEIPQTEKEAAHRGILQNFTNAILYGEPLLSPGTDGIFELTISNAAYLSSWENSKEIPLPLNEDMFNNALAEKIAGSNYRDIEETPEQQSGYRQRWSVNW